MTKIIGVVGRPIDDYYKVNNNFVNIINKYKFICIGIIPPKNDNLSKEEENRLYQVLDLCSGIILQGGHNYYQYDKLIVKYAIKKDIPILGICLGMQVMASIYNDNLTNINFGNHQNVTHNININKKSLLYKIIKKENIKVNSFHNEKIIDSGIYNVSSVSDDNVIESIEYNYNKFNMGVQFHPEKDFNNINMRKIFNYFFDIIKE